MNNQKQDSKWYQISIIVLFLFIIFGMTLFSIFHTKRTFSEKENRLLTTMPAVSIEGVLDGSFMLAYEDYVADQFPLRNTFITIRSYAEIALCKREINGILLGDDGILFEVHDFGLEKTDQAIANQNSLIRFIKVADDLIGEDHIRILLIPTKDAVLSDQLPMYVSILDQSSVFVNLKNHLQNIGLEQTLVDTFTTLMVHHKEELYYKTDHHYTTLGAYYVYKEWAKSMNYNFLTMDEISITSVTQDFEGTLLAKVNLLGRKDEIILMDPYPTIHIEMQKNGTGNWESSLYDLDALSTSDEYAVFQGGNYGLLEINTSVKNNKSLLVIKDSYANCMLPFLTSHYERIIVVDPRFFNSSLTDYMKAGQYTDVLFLFNLPNFLTEKTLYYLK